MIKLVIDPGHGGRDPGGSGNGLLEKNIVLGLSLKLKDYIKSKAYCDVMLTRETDVFVSLSERAGIANRWNADFFLSMHVNAGGGRGFESFIHDSLSRTGRTAKLAKVIHEFVAAVWLLKDRPDRGLKQQNFAVLRETKMPALLVENGFIDNSIDARLLEKASFREKLVRAHGEGLIEALKLRRKYRVADAIRAQRIIVGLAKATPGDLQRLDLDEDGKIAVSDVIKILRIVVGLEKL